MIPILKKGNQNIGRFSGSPKAYQLESEHKHSGFKVHTLSNTELAFQEATDLLQSLIQRSVGLLGFMQKCIPAPLCICGLMEILFLLENWN